MDRNEAIQKQQLLEENLDDTKSVMLQIPGVVAVGIGAKESGGVFTEQIAYRIYVPAKKDLSELAPNEIIPREINGIPTDVVTPLVFTNDSDVCVPERWELSEHRPLNGGIAISVDSINAGTLGWFGTLADGTTVLLTNKHVLYDATNSIDTRKIKTAQPQLGEPSDCCCCTCGSDNVIGESIIGIRDISPPNATAVECGIVKINPNIAANIVFRITNKSTTQVLSVRGTAAAVLNEKVRKIGARSGFTTGKVVHLGDIAVAAPVDSGGTAIGVARGQILIIPDPAETYQVKEGVCKFAFSNGGDSGAVILNDANKIVALSWGGDAKTNAVKITVACHIQNVLDKLSTNGFAVTLSQSPPGESAPVKARIFRKPEPEASTNALETIRDANKDSLLYWLYNKHHGEILQLINHSRPVTVAWQRNQGPAYVAALARSAREENYMIPHTVNGVSRENLLVRLRAVLMAHGSGTLKKDLERFGDELIAAAKRGDSIRQLAENLKETGFIDVLPSGSIPALVR
jgi:hypothetical protein